MLKTVRGLRRAWLGGVRVADVEDAIAELEARNAGLQAKVAASAELARNMADRLTAAEQTLETFHAAIAHIGVLLSLAEERAQHLQAAAESEAAQIRLAAEQRVREADEQVAQLAARKQRILDDLATLRAGLATLAENAGRVPAASVHELPAREPASLPQAGAGP